MKKKGIKIIVIGLIIGILIIVLNQNMLKNKKPVNLQEKEILNGEIVAIMLEQSDGTYIESDDNKWPVNMLYNNELSGCIDNYGNIIENALSFDTNSNTAIVYTYTTGNCYLYFDIIPEEQ